MTCHVRAVGTATPHPAFGVALRPPGRNEAPERTNTNTLEE